MKSIKRRFHKISIKNINLSSYMCFLEATKSQYFSKRTISLWFNELVEKDDYDKKDKKDILCHINMLSNMPQESIKSG